MDADRQQRGDAKRRAVLGNEQVDQTLASTMEIDQVFQEYITGAAWSDVWARDGLELAERSLLTVVILASLGHHNELKIHLQACKRTGVPLVALREAMLHVAIYAGFPRANSGFALLRELFGDGTDDPAP